VQSLRLRVWKASRPSDSEECSKGYALFGQVQDGFSPAQGPTRALKIVIGGLYGEMLAGRQPIKKEKGDCKTMVYEFLLCCDWQPIPVTFGLRAPNDRI
jgi:hypothetical protein